MIPAGAPTYTERCTPTSRINGIAAHVHTHRSFASSTLKGKGERMRLLRRWGTADLVLLHPPGSPHSCGRDSLIMFLELDSFQRDNLARTHHFRLVHCAIRLFMETTHKTHRFQRYNTWWGICLVPTNCSRLRIAKHGRCTPYRSNICIRASNDISNQN